MTDSNVIQGKFGRGAKQKARQKKARSSLCKNGHHSWVVEKNSQFDVKQGKLVTLYKCKRCGAEKKQLQ